MLGTFSQHFRNTPITTKIGAGLGFLIVLILVVTGIAHFSLETTVAEAERSTKSGKADLGKCSPRSRTTWPPTTPASSKA